jgi:protein-disulfide isomerase
VPCIGRSCRETGIFLLAQAPSSPRYLMTTFHAVLTVALSAFAIAGCTRQQPAADTSDTSRTSVSHGASASDNSLLERADAGRIQGDSTAPVWMVIISDFQCPYCRRWHEESYAPLVREFVSTGQLRMAFLQFPLPSHRHAMPAAEATMCASAEGRFWEMHDAILVAQERWSGLSDARPAFDSMATGLGLDMSKWRDCMASRVTQPLIELDLERARQMGVRSTPSFIVGDRAISGAQPLEVFRVAIREAVASARATTGGPR